MRPIFSALVIFVLLLGTAGAGAASVATETVSLGFKEETGLEPAPVLQPPAVENPVSFKVTDTATPIQPILVTQYIYCNRGSEHPGVTEDLKTVTPPFSATLTAPSGSESCQLEAMAEIPAGGVSGTVRIEGEAIRSLESQSPPPSTPKKKCKKGKKLKHGKCVKKGKHPHKQAH